MVYFMYGPGTIDEIIFKMLSAKTEIIADSLDGGRFARQYQISKVSEEDVKEDVKKRKEEGKLNPVIVNKRKKSKVDDFFGPNVNGLKDFVKREPKPDTKASSRRKKKFDEHEEISESSAPPTKEKQSCLLHKVKSS